MFTGWSDMAISAYGTIGYYESVISHDESATDDVKLFMMPGVMHCAGGIGAHVVNWLDEIDNWIEKKTAPDQITAYFFRLKARSTSRRASLRCISWRLSYCLFPFARASSTLANPPLK